MEKMTQTKALAYVLKTYEETLPADVAEKLTAINVALTIVNIIAILVFVIVFGMS